MDTHELIPLPQISSALGDLIGNAPNLLSA